MALTSASPQNARGIKLVLSDVDGTLVTRDKVLTTRAVRAVEGLRDAGIMFALTSARPPQALTRFVEPLGLETPLGAFNGGLIVDNQMRILEEKAIAKALSAPIIGVLEEHDMDVWVYQGENWFVLDEDGPHIEHESQGCSCEPTKVANFHGLDEGILKVVGISEDPTINAAANTQINERFARDVSASQSQSYFLDVTHVEATKGHVVKFLAARYGLDTSEIAVLGDMHNDVSMFEVAGFSVAMGNALDEVQRAADVVTTTNDHEGFANAVETFILT
ncbi:MAG TPA: Cof-type HAD-IIB family hydrolase [Acidimicrobiales bacterium]